MQSSLLPIYFLVKNYKVIQYHILIGHLASSDNEDAIFKTSVEFIPIGTQDNLASHKVEIRAQFIIQNLEGLQNSTLTEPFHRL